MSKRLEIYLPPNILQSAQNGDHAFYNAMQQAFQGIGFDVALCPNRPADLLGSLNSTANIIYHRNSPKTPKTLEVRPAYVGPFWVIDATAVHNEKRIYKAAFDPDNIRAGRANGFFANWSPRVIEGDGEPHAEDGFALIALQGVLGRKRFWQRMSPIEMVKQMKQVESDRQIFIKLHPGETYTDNDMRALSALTDDRVKIVDGPLGPLLASCAYTVSMNSSVSFKGLFYRKPGILFGDADFHHPFQSVSANRPAAVCAAQVLEADVPFEKYVFWYLYMQAINATRDWAPELILSHCADLGWDLGGYQPSRFRPG